MATNLQFIKSVSGTDVSSLSITGFTSQYNVYGIWTSKIIQNGNNDINSRFIDSSGNIISDSEYDYASLVMNSHSSYSEDRQANQSKIDNVGVNDANEPYGVGSVTYIFNPADSSSYTFLTHQSAGMRDIGKLRPYKTVAIHKVAEEITGYNIYGLSGGNITATMALYGVK